MTISSLRFHWLLESYEQAVTTTLRSPTIAARHLWAWTALAAAGRACLLALNASWTGHEAFFITAPDTATHQLSRELAREHYPTTPLRGAFTDHASFFNCAKAEQMLGWRHTEEHHANH